MHCSREGHDRVEMYVLDESDEVGTLTYVCPVCGWKEKKYGRTVGDLDADRGVPQHERFDNARGKVANPSPTGSSKEMEPSEDPMFRNIFTGKYDPAALRRIGMGKVANRFDPTEIPGSAQMICPNPNCGYEGPPAFSYPCWWSGHCGT